MHLLTNNFDITTWKQRGEELLAAIIKEMKGLSETIVIHPMPDILRMTQAQYDDLMKVSGMENMFHSKDQMFVTPYNVMEVRVDKRARLTFEESQNLSDKDFDKWEKSIEKEAQA